MYNFSSCSPQSIDLYISEGFFESKQPSKTKISIGQVQSHSLHGQKQSPKNRTRMDTFWEFFFLILNWLNQSILKKINPEYSLEGLILKLKLQYLASWCGQLTHWESPWCWEILKAEGEGDDRGWDGWIASLTQWIWTWVNSKRW